VLLTLTLIMVFFSRRNLVGLYPSLANGTSTTQHLLMDSQSSSTKPEMRKRLGMDKILNPLAKTPGLRGWSPMPPRRIQYVSSWLHLLLRNGNTSHSLISYDRVINLIVTCAEEMVLLRDAQSYTILKCHPKKWLRKVWSFDFAIYILSIRSL
jgi:hypothetical protein